jgi:hypothetical protein
MPVFVTGDPSLPKFPQFHRTHYKTIRINY